MAFYTIIFMFYEVPDESTRVEVHMSEARLTHTHGKDK